MDENGENPLTERRFQANGDFMLREIAGEYMLIPVGEAANHFNGMGMMSKTATFLWRLFEQPYTVQEAVEAAQARYDGEANEIEQSIQRFIAEGVQLGFLKEER